MKDMNSLQMQLMKNHHNTLYSASNITKKHIDSANFGQHHGHS